MHFRLVAILTLSILIALITSVWYYIATSFPDASLDTLLFYAANGAQGAGEQTFTRAIGRVWWIFGIVLILLISGMYLTSRDAFKRLRLKIPQNLTLVRTYVALLVIMLFASLNYFGATSYALSRYFQQSSLFEDSYVHVNSVKTEFPEEKRNLVMIFAESLETTVMSRQNGGAWPYSLMPEVEALAIENVNFSNNSKLGGMQKTTNAENTSTGLVAQTSGTPLIIGSNIELNNTFNNYKNYLPGLVSLGDIFKSNGYNQKFVLGSDADFGNRKTYFTQHGNVEVYDHIMARNLGAIPSDYDVWWGYEDKKLFEFGKQAALELANKQEPFALTLLTADTHFVDGWLDPSCSDINLSGQYENVHACSSRMIANFINWLKTQDFYENTSVVIVGDHLGMQSGFYENKLPSNYERTIFNTYLNSSVEPVSAKNRQLTSFDTFPTVLASMGVKIEGDRLGLGTNLFSNKSTLAEEMGLDVFNEESAKRSQMYQDCIINNKCSY